MSTSEDQLANPLAMSVADHERVRGIKLGMEAIKAAGAQSEFIAANMIQADAMGCVIVLRAGILPQYNKRRSPKSGINRSKTSNHGFFKGVLTKDVCFGRLMPDPETGSLMPLPHHEVDERNLQRPVTDADYQHTMQLDVNIYDVIREIASDGDLKVLGFDEETGFLRLGYQNEKGPDRIHFDGQFVIDLSQGYDTPLFFSRPWDHPDQDPDWDPDKQMIQKPPELSLMPDEVYERIFNQSFKLYYTLDQSPLIASDQLVKAEVFANRPRTADEFKQAMPLEHPAYPVIESCESLTGVLNALAELESGEAIIRSIYDQAGLIVTGDWDGLLLGHPLTLKPEARTPLNTISFPDGMINMEQLLFETNAYLKELKSIAYDKKTQGEALNAFENKILGIQHVRNIVSDFALSRAGCITPHEFLFQQVLNDAYREQANAQYGEQYDLLTLQAVLDRILMEANIGEADEQRLLEQTRLELEHDFTNAPLSPTLPVVDSLIRHVQEHVKIALKTPNQAYILPHPQHDMNVQDLYQHGFDMRNPYGLNLEGNWILISPGGGVIYGENQQQLTEVLLTGDLLEKNLIDVNPYVEMSAGWGKVIERQIQLNQMVPGETLMRYAAQLGESHTESELMRLDPEFQGKLISALSAYDQTIRTDGFLDVIRSAQLFCTNQALNRSPDKMRHSLEPRQKFKSLKNQVVSLKEQDEMEQAGECSNRHSTP